MILPKIKARSKKRLGRGYGSGKGGHTSSRGTKGQKARTKIHPVFMGTKMKKSLIKRTPLLRGKGKFKSIKNTVIVDISALETIPNGTVVTKDILVKYKIVDEKQVSGKNIKILGKSKINKKFAFEVLASKSVLDQMSEEKEKGTTKPKDKKTKK